MNDGLAYGNRAVAIAQGITGGTRALAVGSGAIAGGDASVAIGDAQAGGAVSFAMGALGTLVGMGVPNVAIANAAADLEITLVGEDWTTVFTGGQSIILFGHAGGTHDPNVNLNFQSLIVASANFSAGDTILTITGVNTTAATAYFVFSGRGIHSIAFGEDVQTHKDHSFAMGQNLAAWGNNNFAFGDGADTGETGGTPPEHAYSFGKNTKTLHDYGHAAGEDAQTRVYGEEVFAHGKYGAVEWAQRRRNFLNAAIANGAGSAPMYPDSISGGTGGVATFSDHVYALTAIVIGSVDDAGTVKAAAWKLEAVFKNDSGTLTQIGTTTVTLLGNADVGVFDTTPTVTPSGQDIVFTIFDDGGGTLNLRWAATYELVELSAA